MEGRFFLIEPGELTAGGGTNTGIAIIGYDAASETCRAYFDSDGRSDTYRLEVREGVLEIEWESYRFTGTFSDDGSTITGTWEQSPDGSSWQYWYDLELTKVG